MKKIIIAAFIAAIGSSAIAGEIASSQLKKKEINSLDIKGEVLMTMTMNGDFASFRGRDGKLMCAGYKANLRCNDQVKVTKFSDGGTRYDGPNGETFSILPDLPDCPDQVSANPRADMASKVWSSAKKVRELNLGF